MKSLPEMQPGIKLASRVQQAQCSLQTVPPSERLRNIIGTPEKENCASSSAAKDQGGQAARKLGHAVTGDLAVSSRQMFLRTTQEEPGHCQE